MSAQVFSLSTPLPAGVSWPTSFMVTTPEEVALNARALRLWPDDARNRAEWLRAVRVVRATTGGWLLDRRVEKAAP